MSLPVALCLLLVLPRAARAAPSVVFLLLDTMRADRLSAWGGPNPTSPNLDALAAAGVRFAQHFANSHATRPSMPQLMSGRYYHQNILRDFRSNEHPREFPFSRPDASAVLLPAVLRERAYRTVGVSAHPWVVAESEFGRGFEHLELVPSPVEHGHAAAAAVVDRGLALWRERDPERPLLLYLHFMDPHLPRSLAAGDEAFVGDVAEPGRFRSNGEPAFGRERRRWAREDATDFTPADRAYFAAVYDAKVRSMDREIGRLLDAIRAEDPDLDSTLVVAVADHGEELGEDGRTEHTDSLADAVQHIPWIMAGAGINPGQVVTRFTENVDVLPTVLARLDIPLPPGVRTDGGNQLAADGSVCLACSKRAAFYAWETYRAVRTGNALLRQETPRSLRAVCLGTEQFYETATPHRALTGAPALALRLRRKIERQLDARERAFLRTRYRAPERSFILRPAFWRVADGTGLRCVPVGPDTQRRALDALGWLWSGRGVTVMERDGGPPVRLALPVPDAEYQVDVGAVPVRPMPWLFGFARWRRRSFLDDSPVMWVPMGTVRASAGILSLALPEEAGVDQHLVGIRLTPPGVAPTTGNGAGDPELRERLRALGYVQ